MCVALALMCVSLPRVASANDLAKAREHFKRGSTLYYLQHYLEAAAEYEKAFEIRDEPSLLFNIGQAYRLAGEHQKAIGAYRSYLARLPEAPNRQEVLALIESTRKALEAQQRSREKPPTGTLPSEGGESTTATVDKPQPEAKKPEPSQPPAKVELARPAVPVVDPTLAPRARRLRLAGLGVGAAGVVSVALGVTFAALTASTNTYLHQGSQPPGNYDFDAQDRGYAYQTAYPVLFAVGGAAVITGAVLYAVGVKRGRAARLTPSVGRDGAGASLSFGF